MKRAAYAAIWIIAGLASSAARADFVIAGVVLEGNNFSEGIYNVLVEVVQGEKVLASARTAEKGDFKLAVPTSVPFTGVLRYSKVGYKAFPTRMPLQARQQSTSVKPILLIRDGASDDYMTQLTDELIRSKKSGNMQQINALIHSIVFLPPTNKSLIFEKLLGKDKELYSSLQQANQAQLAANEYQVELRKKDPQVLVWPDYATATKKKFLVYGAPAKASEPRLTIQQPNEFHYPETDKAPWSATEGWVKQPLSMPSKP